MSVRTFSITVLALHVVGAIGCSQQPQMNDERAGAVNQVTPTAEQRATADAAALGIEETLRRQHPEVPLDTLAADVARPGKQRGVRRRAANQRVFDAARGELALADDQLAGLARIYESHDQLRRRVRQAQRLGQIDKAASQQVMRTLRQAKASALTSYLGLDASTRLSQLERTERRRAKQR